MSLAAVKTELKEGSACFLKPVLLNRTTENEGLVVDAGYCDLNDPRFCNAAER